MLRVTHKMSIFARIEAATSGIDRDTPAYKLHVEDRIRSRAHVVYGGAEERVNLTIKSWPKLRVPRVAREMDLFLLHGEELRTRPHTGYHLWSDYIYPEPDTIMRRLQAALDRYHTPGGGLEGGIMRAVRLVYDLTEIRPWTTTTVYEKVFSVALGEQGIPGIVYLPPSLLWLHYIPGSKSEHEREAVVEAISESLSCQGF